MQAGCGHGNVKRRQILSGVGVDNRGVGGAAIAESHLYLTRALDDVIVGQDIAVVIEHDAGTGRRAPARPVTAVRVDRDHAF